MTQYIWHMLDTCLKYDHVKNMSDIRLEHYVYDFYLSHVPPYQGLNIFLEYSLYGLIYLTYMPCICQVFWRPAVGDVHRNHLGQALMYARKQSPPLRLCEMPKTVQAVTLTVLGG